MMNKRQRAYALALLADIRSKAEQLDQHFTDVYDRWELPLQAVMRLRIDAEAVEWILNKERKKDEPPTNQTETGDSD